jgi:fumarate hydratase subunit beta
MVHLLQAPLTEDQLLPLYAGDEVVIEGLIYVARDAAHQRMAALLAEGLPLPFDPNGQMIYYMGPTPPKPGQVIGSAGPTTAGRVDRYTPALLAAGLKATIGKGYRSAEVRAAMVQHKAVYLAAIGGAGALISRSIRSREVIAWPELGTEALQRLEVNDFICFVVNDIYGNDLYEQGRAQWSEKIREDTNA